MEQPVPARSIRKRSNWMRVLIIALVIEKIIQHIFVTLAFAFNWMDIRATVAVDPGILLVLGAIVAALFMLALWGLLAGKPWALTLVAALALFDLLGEFIAQGTLAIVLNVSFLVATTLLVLTILYRRNLPRATN